MENRKIFDQPANFPKFFLIKKNLIKIFDQIPAFLFFGKFSSKPFDQQKFFDQIVKFDEIFEKNQVELKNN